MSQIFPATQVVHPALLTRQLKAVVPDVSHVQVYELDSVDVGTEPNRAFTTTEARDLATVIAAHDGAAEETRIENTRTMKRTAIRQDPSTMSDHDRIVRIERILRAGG